MLELNTSFQNIMISNIKLNPITTCPLDSTQAIFNQSMKSTRILEAKTLNFSTFKKSK